MVSCKGGLGETQNKNISTFEEQNQLLDFDQTVKKSPYKSTVAFCGQINVTRTH